MKKRYLLLASLLIIFSACRKESIILDEPTTTLEPPTELEGVFINGQITDNDANLVVGAVVRFYQGGEQIGEALTDENGQYNSADIPLLKDKEVTLAVEEEAYAAKYKRTETAFNETTDLRLIKKSGAFGQDKILKNPGDPNLVKLFGTFTDRNGEPIANAHSIIAWEFTKISDDKLKFEGVFDQTDANGYVELLAPPGEELFFLSLPDYNSFECTGYISEEEVNILDWGVYFDNIGVVNTNQELIEQTDLNFSFSDYTIYGNFQNCDGNPVSSGEATLKISYTDGEPKTQTYKTTEFDSKGEYIFDITLCNYDGDIDIELSLINQDTFGTELMIPNVPVSGIHLAPQKACDDLRPVILTSELHLNIGTEYSFDFIFTHEALEEPYSFVFSNSHPEISGFNSFAMENIVIGENTISNLSVGFLSTLSSRNPFDFTSIGQLMANVTDISNGLIIGTLEGEVETSELGIQLVTGDFIVRYE